MAKTPNSAARQVRIIAGKWRGRRLRFPGVAGLRPTPDRMRETLFNWLAPSITGASCLDLYAGSGALGLEAVSRGAERAILVEQNRRVVATLADTCALLETRQVDIVQADCLSFLSRTPQPVDVVFVDPPYEMNLQGKVCQLLESRGWLRPHGLVYLEGHRREEFDVPSGWKELRRQRAGNVCGYLYQAG